MTERMLAVAFDTRGEREHVICAPREAGPQQHFGDLRPSERERAGFVHGERVQRGEFFDGGGIADEHAHFGTATDADHHAHRRGEAERAWTGDDQDRNGAGDGVNERGLWSKPPPQGEGQHGCREHCGHKPGRDLVRQRLHRRTTALGLADQLHDLRQQRLRADTRGLHDEAALLI